jgi:hypothetical protein
MSRNVEWARTTGDGRQTVGSVHLVTGDSDRTACGLLYRWNWYTTKSVAGTGCRNCLKVATRQRA